MNSIQKLVLLDTLGLLDEQRRQALQEARADDPVIRHLYRLLDPNAVDVPAPLVKLANELATSLTAKLAIAEIVAAWRTGILAADRSGRLPEDMPIVQPWPLTGDNRFSTRHELDLRSAAKSEGGPDENDFKPLPELPFTCVRDHVLVSEQRQEDIPFALARVLAMRDGKPFHSKIVVMKLENNHWSLSLPLGSLFGGDVPDGEPDYYLSPANEASASWFPIDEVKAIHNSLPTSWAVERDRVSDFIAILECGPIEVNHE